jgi:hypothetical protein
LNNPNMVGPYFVWAQPHDGISWRLLA